MKNGFTLIEILVTISIFGSVVVMISAVYIGFSHIQARANATQRILNDSQFILEAMAREIRNDLILDYNPTDARCEAVIGDNYLGCILLQREDGQVVTFTHYFNSADATDSKNGNLYFILLGNCDDTLTTCQWGDAYTDDTQNYESYTIMLGPSLSNIQVDALAFNITPDTDPFVLGGPARQPKVTVQLDVSYASTGDEFKDVRQLLQTTVSSRVYRK